MHFQAARDCERETLAAAYALGHLGVGINSGFVLILGWTTLGNPMEGGVGLCYPAIIHKDLKRILL
jgi:hypothetical protein